MKTNEELIGSLLTAASTIRDMELTSPGSLPVGTVRLRTLLLEAADRINYPVPYSAAVRSNGHGA